MARKDHIRTCLNHDLIFWRTTACAANMQPHTYNDSDQDSSCSHTHIHNWTLKDHNLGQVQHWIFRWAFLCILHSHDSLLGVHEYWQWNHNLQRSGKGLERLLFQFPLFESRADIQKFVHLQTCYSVIMIHYSNLRALSFNQNGWPLTHNGNYICCLHQNSIDWVDESLNVTTGGWMCLTDTMYSVPWFMYIKLEDNVEDNVEDSLCIVHTAASHSSPPPPTWPLTKLVYTVEDSVVIDMVMVACSYICTCS